MKHTLLFFLFFLQVLSTQAQHHQDKPSVHGMTLMGTEKIYASHLPMFHSPHDYQIILQLKFTDEVKAKYLKELQANPQEVLYTLEPEVFVLPEMIQKTKKFKANLYRGHFERGGVKFLENVYVEIAQVVYFKKFDGNSRSVNLQYILFGNAKEQFMAHLIAAKPDFDENLIVTVKNSKIVEYLTKKSFIWVYFDEKDERKPFSWQKNIGEVVIKKTSLPIEFTLHKTLYLEFGDLD